MGPNFSTTLQKNPPTGPIIPLFRLRAKGKILEFVENSRGVVEKTTGRYKRISIHNI
jgi:hypothetical protein